MNRNEGKREKTRQRLELRVAHSRPRAATLLAACQRAGEPLGSSMSAGLGLHMVPAFPHRAFTAVSLDARSPHVATSPLAPVAGRVGAMGRCLTVHVPCAKHSAVPPLTGGFPE